MCMVFWQIRSKLTIAIAAEEKEKRKIDRVGFTLKSGKFNDIAKQKRDDFKGH